MAAETRSIGRRHGKTEHDAKEDNARTGKQQGNAEYKEMRTRV